MAKLYFPHAFRGVGRFADVMVFQSWKGIYYCRKKPKYVYTNTPEQKTNRAKFAEAVHSYQELDEIERMLWRVLAYGKKMSGYEYYLKKYMEDR